MTKTNRMLSLLLVMLLCLSLCSCKELDAKRAVHAVLDKDGTILWNETVYKPLPKFPAVQRDFALLCDIDLPIGTLEKAIASGASRLLEKIELFDIYTGSQIPEGKKSVAFSVSLRSAEATLSDEEIDAVTAKIIAKLEKTGAELRK